MFYEYLNSDIKWDEFLDCKLNSIFVDKRELRLIKDYVINRKYFNISKKLVNNEYVFSIPKKIIINKINNSKKRVVYSYNNDEMLLLKFVSYILYDYDYLFGDNLYSFRKNNNVKNAVVKLKSINKINNMYAYKVDISNYFNSIDVDILLSNLKNDIKDVDLYNFISKIISNKKVNYMNNIIEEDKGIMAGIPISAFLANYYIREIDYYFKKNNVLYLRYSDDIIFFCNDMVSLDKYIGVLKAFFVKYNLVINIDKEMIYKPGDVFEFLGFSFSDGNINISNHSFLKIKKKIKRYSKRMRKLVVLGKLDEEVALKKTIDKFNKKFFGKDDLNVSWCDWYFRCITCSDILRDIDHYFQDNLRFIVTGKHYKKNFKKVPYSYLKSFGYKSLVNEYFLFINMKNDM